MNRRRHRYRWREIGASAGFLLPALAVFGVFTFYPLVRSVWLSFHANDLLGRPVRFVGLDQYTKFFEEPELRRVLLTTALFAILTVLPTLLIGLFLALVLQTRVRGIGVFRTVMATPFAFSAASAAVVFDAFYSPSVGVFNGILHNLGIPQVDWLTSPSVALPSLALVIIWRDIGYAMLVCSAGLQSIPDQLFEAARIDGAGYLTLLRKIILPLLTPTMFFLLVVGTIGSLQTFGEINILTGGGPDGATTTLVYNLYQSAFAFGVSDYGLASAQAVILLFLVMGVTAVQFTVLQRKVFYS
ncbi:MAG TPA: sugar ABC transporter permease [Natronosporangium sp.]